MKAQNKHIIFILGTIISLIFLNCTLGTQEQYKGRDKRMEYCFDAAFDTARDRLYVVAGYAGMHVFDVSDGKLNFVTTIYDEGYYRNIKVSGDRAYIADAYRGLLVFDISKEIPVLTWKWKDVKTDSRGMGIYIESNLAYLAVDKGEKKSEKPGLYIFNISKQDSPKLLGYCEAKHAWDVWVSGRYAYVASLKKGLMVIDVSSASSPKKVARATWSLFPCAEIVRGEGKFIYIAAGWRKGLVVVDIGNPLKPKVIGKFKSSIFGCGEGLCVKDRIVYLANGNKKNSEENGLYIIDVQNPSSPIVLGKCTFSDWVEGVCSAGNYVFVTNTGSGVRSIDVRNPEKPCMVDHFGPIIE